MVAKDKILKLFEEKKELTIVSIVDTLNISKQYVHRVIIQLLDKGIIVKYGTAPKTFYRINQSVNQIENRLFVENKNIEYLQKNFIVITEIGEFLEGLIAFEFWCNKRKLPFEKTLDEYILTKKKYDNYFNKYHLIDGLEKLKNTKGFDYIYLDNLFYLDFYAIERFGKTRLGTILHYAKQGQSKPLMKLLIEAIKKHLNDILDIYQIDAIAFVPPTIKRETQLMKVLESGLKLNKPKIILEKYSGLIPVPQKSLNKLEERINNADNTFMIKSSISYKNVLLIDDAVGSGSTLNQIAKKIKNNALAQNIIGLAIVGSYKGFDVITDI
jgi:uracil phosphoribosyltransferase